MAIIPIKDIPQTRSLAPTQRDFIRADIREAIKLGVSKFEFDGEYYKYKTLKNNAKEAFKALFINEIYNPGVAKAEKRLKKELPAETITLPTYDKYIDKAAKFSTVKSQDRVHVYCALDLNLINGIDGYLYIDALKALYKNLPK
jgi:hypothetical protein